MNMLKPVWTGLVSVILFAGLSACGQKGDLYLPANEPVRAKASIVESTPHSPVSESVGDVSTPAADEQSQEKDKPASASGDIRP